MQWPSGFCCAQAVAAAAANPRSLQQGTRTCALIWLNKALPISPTPNRPTATVGGCMLDCVLTDRSIRAAAGDGSCRACGTAWCKSLKRYRMRYMLSSGCVSMAIPRIEASKGVLAGVQSTKYTLTALTYSVVPLLCACKRIPLAEGASKPAWPSPELYSLTNLHNSHTCQTEDQPHHQLHS